MFKKLKLGTKISIIIGALILVCYLGVFASILVQVKSKSISDSETLAKEVSLSYATQITSSFKQLEIVGKDQLYAGQKEYAENGMLIVT